MIAIISIGVIIIYVLLSIFIVRLAPRFATTAKGKKWARGIALFIVLWYPAIEPAISYVVFRSYAAMHAGAKIYKTIDNVDRVLFEGPGMFSRLDLTASERNTLLSKEGATFEGNKLLYDYVEEKFAGYPLYQYAYNARRRVEIYESKAMYIVRWSIINDMRYISSSKYTIVTRDGDILGEYIDVIWCGGGIMLFSLHGGGQAYDAIPKNHGYHPASFVISVLRPSTLK